MALDWSDDIAVANLADEPALSDELAAVIERLGADAGVPHVVLDFHEVNYMNSSNIAQLLELRKALEDRGRQLILCSLGDEVRSVLDISGLDKLFRIRPDTMTAIASVQIEDTPAS